MTFIRLVSGCFLAVLLMACQSPITGDEGAERDATLYHALGQRSGIEAIVEDLMYLIVDDTRIAFQFRGLDVNHFHSRLSDQLCELAGGPCRYTGRSMAESHQAMAITETQFNALVENLVLALERNGISTAAQNQLLAQLAPIHGEIVAP